MTKNKYRLQETSRLADSTTFRVVPCGVAESRFANNINTEYGGDSSTVFDDGGIAANIQEKPITVNGREYKYVPWGVDDQLPYKVKEQLLSNMITAQCQSFNIISCYGQGVRFVDRTTKKEIGRAHV